MCKTPKFLKEIYILSETVEITQERNTNDKQKSTVCEN